MTSPPNPWAYLAEHPSIRLVWQELPEGLRGATDGHSTIWLSPHLSQRERRCTLTHELVHIGAHHTGHQPPAIERSVRCHTARLLLPDVCDIVDAMASTADITEAACDLWVSDDVLTDRLVGLHPAERAYMTMRGIEFVLRDG